MVLRKVAVLVVPITDGVGADECVEAYAVGTVGEVSTDTVSDAWCE